MIRKFKIFEGDNYHHDECPKGIFHVNDRVICKGEKYGVRFDGKDREWTCKKCGSIHDRDNNACYKYKKFWVEEPTSLKVNGRIVLVA